MFKGSNIAVGLSSQSNRVTIKKAMLYAIRAATVASSFIFASPSSAQVLNKEVDIGGQKVGVFLEAMDVTCVKPKPIAVNKLLCLRVIVKGANDAWLKGFKILKFDAVMPGHHHGMVTRPKVTTKKLGEYWLEGVKLHMAGDWSLELKLEQGQAAAQVAIPLKL